MGAEYGVEIVFVFWYNFSTKVTDDRYRIRGIDKKRENGKSGGNVVGKDAMMADLEKQQKQEAAEVKKKEKELLKQQAKAEKEAKKKAKAEAKAEAKAAKDAEKQQVEAETGKETKVKEKIKVKIPKISKNDKETEPVEKKEKFKNTIPLHRRIATKLILAFMIPVACIVVLGVVSYNKAASAIEDNYRSAATQTVDMMDRYVTTAMDNVQADFRNTLVDDEFKGLFSGLMADDPPRENALRTDWNNTFLKMPTSDDMYSNVYVLYDKKQVLIATSLVSKDGLYTEYKGTEQGNKVVNDKFTSFWFGNDCEADASLGTNSSKYAIRYAHWATNKSVIIADVSYDYIMSILNTLDAGEGSYVGLVTNMDGQEILGDRYALPETPVFVGNDFYNEILEAEEESGSKEITYNGEDYLFIYSKIPSQDAAICALILNDTITAQAAEIGQITVIVVILAVIVALALGIIFASNMSGAIGYMCFKLQKVAEGDLTVSVHTKRTDEFKLLIEEMSETIKHIKHLITNVTSASDDLNLASEQVAESSKMFMQTSEGIQSAVAEIELGIAKLDEDSEDCLNQMDALSHKIGTVTEGTGVIGQLADATGESIKQGVDSVSELTGTAQSTTEITTHVVEAIGLLETKTRSIGQIIGVINGIAEQTNLLSLNASIEAARAGEAGRGFSVVAEEIRKLADQSLGSAKQISKIVDEIVANMGEVVNVAKKAEDVVKQQEESVSNTTNSFNEMDGQVQTLVESLENIKENVNNMETARAATLGAIESISAVSAETAACSTNVSEMASKQMEAIHTLDDAASQLTARAEELAVLLQEFKI